MFRINLHKDDVAVLHKIKEQLGIGSVETHANSCVFIVRNVADLLNVLIPILDANPLRTTKYLDYLDFKRMVVLLNNAPNSAVVGADKELAQATITGMNTARTLTEEQLSLIPQCPINPYWLLGFVEGEGTFGVKNMVPYFQLGQHARSAFVIDAISKYLQGLQDLFGFTLNSPTLSPNVTINKKTNVHVLSLSNVDSLHDTLAHFFLGLPFQTRKETDFLYWCVLLHMHKFGYAYLAEGRKLAVAIANYINTSRYSNSDKNPAVPVLSMDLFNTILPVILTPTMSHLHLTQAFAKVRGTLNIWVYDKGNLVLGSPFNGHAEASTAVGVSRTSRTVARYLDTGKLYNNRYTFYSTAKSN